MPGKKSKPSGAFSAPPTDGTANSARAARWEGASQNSSRALTGGRSRSPGDDAPASRGQSYGADSQRSQSRGGSSRGGSRSGKKGKPKISDEYYVEWFGKPGEHDDVPGKLVHTSSLERCGMVNPPRNPEVQADLLEYLSSRKVPSKIDPKRHLRQNDSVPRVAVVPPASQTPPSRHKKQACTSDWTISLPVDQASDGFSSQREDVFAATAPAGFGVGNAGSSRAASPSVGSRGTHAPASGGPRKSVSTGGLFRKSKPVDVRAWIDMQKERKSEVKILHDSEEKWKRGRLILQSREHGFVLDKKEVEELGELNMYNNKLSRSLEKQKPPQLMVGAGGQLVMQARGTIHASAGQQLRDVAAKLQTSWGYGDEKAVKKSDKTSSRPTIINHGLTEDFVQPVIRRLRSHTVLDEAGTHLQLAAPRQRVASKPRSPSKQRAASKNTADANSDSATKLFARSFKDILASPTVADEAPQRDPSLDRELASDGYQSRAREASAPADIGSSRASQRRPIQSRAASANQDNQFFNLDSFGSTGDSFASWRSNANSRASTRESEAYEVGEIVEAMDGSNQNWWRVKITDKNLDGSYGGLVQERGHDIQWDRIEPRFMRKAPSSKRLLEMAEMVKSAGPNRLEAMAQAARISVLTGRKLPIPPTQPVDTRERHGSPSRGVATAGDDFGGRAWRSGFSAPEESGRQLPVLNWGRTGSAPTLMQPSAVQ